MELDDLHQRFGWGDLQHHDMLCVECAGTTFNDDDQSCEYCDGTGVQRWGSFYVQDHGECDFCLKKDVPIAAMYEDADTNKTWVCLPCYLKHHKDAQCCELWKEAEEAFGLGDRCSCAKTGDIEDLGPGPCPVHERKGDGAGPKEGSGELVPADHQGGYEDPR